MSGLSFLVNRGTRGLRGKFANWVAEEAVDIFDVPESKRPKVKKLIYYPLMAGSGILMSVLLADPAGLLDPEHFLNAADAITAFDTADAVSTATSATSHASDIVTAAGPDDAVTSVDASDTVSEATSSDPTRFGSATTTPGTSTTTTFPDGTQIENAHTDAQGSIYENSEDWKNGTNKYTPVPKPDAPSQQTAYPG